MSFKAPYVPYHLLPPAVQEARRVEKEWRLSQQKQWQEAQQNSQVWIRARVILG